MVRSLSVALLASIVVLTTSSADAAPTKKKSAKSTTAVKAKPIDAAAVEEPVMVRSADGMMTPLPVKLRPTTAAEAEANAVWNVRAALNIAALQCQFSTFLATVRNYNDALRQHGNELEHARATMVAHFKRYDKARAQDSFDRYTTQTYNSFSTLDAQLAFCDRAALAGRLVLTIPKGALGKSAASIRDDVRAALIPVAALSLLKPELITPEPLPPL